MTHGAKYSVPGTPMGKADQKSQKQRGASTTPQHAPMSWAANMARGELRVRYLCAILGRGRGQGWGWV